MSEINPEEGKTSEGQNLDGESTVKTEEEMNEEELDALHASEKFIEEFDPEKLGDLDDEQLTELKKQLGSAKTTIAQKRHYRTKLVELEKGGNGKPLEKKEEKPAAPAAKKEEETRGVDPQVATEFRLDHPEYSKDVAKKILEHAGAYNISPEEATKDPLMQAFIKGANATEDAEGASVTPSQTSGGAVAERDWSNASPQEMEEARNKILFPDN